MEKLHEYLKGKKAKDFAKEVGLSDCIISQYRRGHRVPTFANMLKIEKATGGAVSRMDWALPASSDNKKTERAE